MAKHSFDAVIFDLDGVITKTANVHSRAWKKMFNDYLKFREEEYGEKFEEFTHEGDYLPHVDGKPRYKGVADFLKSRKIDLPYGDPSDAPEKETACGLGNRKNEYFTSILEEDGVEVYESTVQLIKDLQKENIRLGVASSSKNCKKVLEAAELSDYFETRVDGVVSAEIGLNGKPEPDIFTTACDNLGVDYDRSVVVEDAVSGVQAGQKGGFGLTLGLDREGNREALKKNGADIVLNDISELGGIPALDKWFETRAEDLKWNLLYHVYDPDKEKSREALLSTGNGFFATRGAMEETSAGEHNYPGSYMAGLYNRRKSKVSDKWIENEDFVNFINWLPVSFRIEGGEWFDPNKHNFDLEERRLDLKTGVLYRSLIVNHEDGRKTRVESSRFVSMANPHLGALEYRVLPLNYSGLIEVYSGIDGDLINDGVERYRDLDQHHLDQLDQGRMNEMGYVIVKTNQSDITISVTEKLSLTKGTKSFSPEDFHTEKGKIKTFFKLNISKGESGTLRKLVSIKNSRDFETYNPLGASIDELSNKQSWDTVLSDSIKAWAEIWKRADLEITGDRYSQMLLRLHIYHLYTTASPHYKDLDFGIPARGLHGEAYRGHIFWDELYALPFYIANYPEIARSVLMYRYRRIDEARKYAEEHDYEGIMFPWQSGSSGREETQVIHLNPVSGEWGPDYSSLQRHISIAVAYNIWQYYQITADQDFMNSYGAEMFFGICRFWASKCVKNEENGRYSIKHVMGPDEFHEKLPESDEGGVTDNAYTNLMVVWCLRTAFDIMDQLSIEERKRIVDKIVLKKEELVKWKDISSNINININEDGIIEQFEGYFGLKEIDFDEYREKYDYIHRMDRILKAEGKSPDAYKVAKQADTLMVYYNLDPSEVQSIIKRLGYDVPDDMLKRNFNYYIERTSHGSTLSRVVHAYLAKLMGGNEKAWDLYIEALESDYVDIQGGTTAEGIHMGVMGGTVLAAISVFAGLNWRGDALRLDPDLPGGWKEMKFSFSFKGGEYKFVIGKEKVKVTYKGKNNEEVRIFINGMKFVLSNEKEVETNL
jgi:beta-phosphoglucomutase family hydrolase